MAHTLTEQALSNITAANVQNIFLQQLGYTKDGDYMYSPVDTDFGVKIPSGDYLTIYVTFDHGVSNVMFMDIYMSYISSFCYHISMNEKVIYFRITYTLNGITNTLDIIIAHDEKNKTAIFSGDKSTATKSSSDYNVYIFEKNLSSYVVDNNSYAKINADMSNAIYRYPSLKDFCLCSELYGVTNTQMFPSQSNTYVNFGGQPYRIITCMKYYNGDMCPYFAFPVSD